MLILFDHGTPRSIARWLQGHTVVEAIARGCDRLSNDALLQAAEEAGFDLLLSTGKNIQYQQIRRLKLPLREYLALIHRTKVQMRLLRRILSIKAFVPTWTGRAPPQ